MTRTKFIILPAICMHFFVNCFSQSEIKISDDGKGRIFEGIGALSAGASSKLLNDYPPEVQDEIFDFLFKPKFGAGLQALKVEIGGDVNSTDGTEPSHAHTRTEFLSLDSLNFQKGYEWLILKNAQKRNPSILFDCLEWGCPGWIGQGIFYSQDNADYISSFIKGAAKYQGVKFDFTGIWNERPYDAQWIKLLRKTLDKNGLREVKIIAPDNFDWNIADSMKNDRELNDAIYALGNHYNERWEKNPYSSTEVAQSLNKPMYNSEGGPWRGDWEGFEYLAKLYNRNYVIGKNTRVITWSLITSYYDNLIFPNSGLMRAKTPWSGYYEVQPAIWAAAHTTQFTEPGWRYVDSGCGLRDFGSYVTLCSENKKDFSIIIESMDAIESQTITFSIAPDFAIRKLHVWKSTKGKCEFEQQEDIKVKNNKFVLSLDGKSIYSLTTTQGQAKGHYYSNENTSFPIPYSDDFESEIMGQPGKYFMDQAGGFEVRERTDGKGKCLKQVVEYQGNEWEFGMLSFVSSIIGDTCNMNYQVVCDVNIAENTGSAMIMGRVIDTDRARSFPKGYWFKILSNGKWALHAGNKLLTEGVTGFSPFKWYKLSLMLHDEIISISINDKEITTVTDSTYTHGLAGIGCDFNVTEFDNFKLK